MDENYLRIIANPLRLKNVGKKRKKSNINDYLYFYLEKKYPDVYIHHTVYYKIIENIDKIINQTIIDQIVNDLIESIIKFDNTNQLNIENE